MKSLSADTTPEAQQTHFALMRQLPDWKRLKLALDLTLTMRELVLADILHRYPDAGEEEVRRRFISRVLPREQVMQAYGFDPELEGY